MKRVVMYPLPVDPDQFKRHYLEQHVPLCRKISGRLRIRYAFAPETIR